MTTSQENDRIIEAINDVFRHLEDWSYEELVAGFQAIEGRFSHLATTDPASFRELRRRLAEDILLVAQDKERALSECEALLEGVRALGWTDLYREAQVLLPLARYCVDKGRPELARGYLEPLVPRLEAEWQATKDDAFRNHLNAIRRMLDRITP